MMRRDLLLQPPTPPGPTAPPVPTEPVVQGPGSNIALPGAPSAPMTAADVAALRSRRSELSNQLQSVEGRRDEVIEEIQKTSDPAVLRGLQQRLQVLDARLAQLELDIAANGRLLAAAPANLQRTTETQPARVEETGPAGLNSGQVTAISIVFTVAVLMPLAIAFARRLLRAPVPAKSTPEQVANAERLARMEQAVDAIAVEVERISEGQRFVTQLMAQRQPALGVGQAPAEPIPVPQAVRQER